MFFLVSGCLVLQTLMVYKLLIKINFYGKPIANKYCEGTVKRTVKSGLPDLTPLRRKW
jgi:hypothetical protein